MSERPAPAPATPVRCAYCLSGQVSIGVCVSCRTELEEAKRKFDEMRRELEGWRRRYFKLVDERLRGIKKSGGRAPL